MALFVKSASRIAAPIMIRVDDGVHGWPVAACGQAFLIGVARKMMMSLMNDIV